MAVLKCKMCGGELNIQDGMTVAECEYCGTTQTLPKLVSDDIANLYDRANHFRRNNDFDKAEGIYERILSQTPEDAEVYWSLVLCRYGIEYVEDPATRKRVPTVNRAQYTSIFDDENYKAALEHADAVQRRVYEDEAAAINEIQKGILAISQKEEPFDVFICYKESDNNGRRTPDSVLATDLYHQLTNEGFKVFFSRITLEDKLGTAYEPYIFAALNSAKVMVVLGTKPEYFNAVWVKNEWSRYLALVKQSGGKKVLIPAYRDMDPYDLPEEFSHLQAQDMSKLGFMQDLIRGIKKITGADKQKTTVVQQVVQGTGGANLTAQLKRGQQALEDRDWSAAEGFFEKALDIDAECAEAFYGKALAATQCRSGEELLRQRLAIPIEEKEKLTACDKDTKRITEATKTYQIPEYFTTSQIKNCFSYDERHYSSLTRAWRRRVAQEKDYWEKDRLMSRALRFAKENFAVTLTQQRERIESTLQNRLKESEEKDTAQAEKLSALYAEEMEKASQTVQEQYEKAKQLRRQNYETYCKNQENAVTMDDYDKAAACFELNGMRGYRDSDQRAEQCRAEEKRLKAERDVEEARKRAEHEAKVAQKKAEERAAAEEKAKAEAKEREQQRIAEEKAAAALKKKRIKIAIVVGVLVVIASIAIGFLIHNSIASSPLEVFDGFTLGDPVSSFPENESEKELVLNSVNGHLYSDSSDGKTIDSLYWVSSNSNGNTQEIVDTARDRIIEALTSKYGKGTDLTVPDGVIPYKSGEQTATQFITRSGVVYLVGPDSKYNIYLLQIEEPYK